MRNDRFVASFGDHSKIVQILQQLFVVTDWEDDGGAVAMLVGQILEDLAQGAEATLGVRRCRGSERLAALEGWPTSDSYGIVGQK